MKKGLMVLIMVFFALADCSKTPDDDASGTASGSSVTKLKIVNSSSSFLELVKWLDNSGTAHYFCPDSVWDSGISMNCSGLASGHSFEKTVTAGNSAVYFYFVNSGTLHYTANTVNVPAGSSVTFTFTGSTMVYSIVQPSVVKSGLPGLK